MERNSNRGTVRGSFVRHQSTHGTSHLPMKTSFSLENCDDPYIAKAYNLPLATNMQNFRFDKITQEQVAELYELFHGEVTVLNVNKLLTLEEIQWTNRDRLEFFKAMFKYTENNEELEELSAVLSHFDTKANRVKDKTNDLGDIGCASMASMGCKTQAVEQVDFLHMDGQETVIPLDIMVKTCCCVDLKKVMLSFRNPNILKDLQRREAIDATEVTRQDLMQHVHRVVERDDAFITLPWTLFYILLFMVMVATHLIIYGRHTMEASLESWINGRDPKTAADLNVDNLESWWEWVGGVGIPGVFDGKTEAVNGTFPKYIVASRHVVVGGIRMECLTLDGEVFTEWLLESKVGMAHLKANPGDHKQASLVAAEAFMKETPCGTYQAERIWMSFMAYNEFAKAYSSITAWVWIDRYGGGNTVMNAEAVPVDPYPDWFIIAADITFALLVARIFLIESISMVQSLRLGCNEFKDYWDLWNTVDWLSIFFSGMVCLLLALDSFTMLDPSLNFIFDSNYKLNRDVMELNKDELDGLYETVLRLQSQYAATHSVMAINTIVLLFRFFKSFQSNPRLKVVTDTFVQAAVDLAHFFIIFLTLFMPLAIIAHIMFGCDIPEFGSLFATLSTGIYTLLGDYSWYEEAAPEYVWSYLPSGMPAMFVFLWFFVFHFLITLVVLNMLLGIVLHHYVEITERLKGMGNTAPAIWVQIQEYLKWQKDTRGWIPLPAIDRGLQNDENPSVKPTVKVIDEDELMIAFDNMKPEQAKFLMNFLKEQVFETSGGLEDYPVSILDLKDLALESATNAYVVLEDVGDLAPRFEKKIVQCLEVMENMRTECQVLQKRLQELGEKSLSTGTSSSDMAAKSKASKAKKTGSAMLTAASSVAKLTKTSKVSAGKSFKAASQ